MTGCDHVRPDIGAYVLGGLEHDEAAAVREHLASCAACADEHANLAGLPRLLALAAPMAEAGPPAPALEERVLDAVASERPRPAPRRRRLPRPRVLVAAGAALAAVAIAIVLALGGGGDANGPAGYEIALRPVAGGAAQRPRAARRAPTAAPRCTCGSSGLPADPDVVYEVQCDAPGWSASAGTFRADSHGRAYVVLSAPPPAAASTTRSAWCGAPATSSTDVLQAKL